MAANAAMIKISFVEDAELGTKLMKMPLEITVAEAIQQIIGRFKLPDDRPYELVNAGVVLQASSILQEQGVVARTILEIRTVRPAAAEPIDIHSLPMEQWDANAVLLWLKKIELGPAEPDTLVQFTSNQITGQDLLDLDDSDLKEQLQIKALGARKKILRERDALKGSSSSSSSSSSPATASLPPSPTPAAVAASSSSPPSFSASSASSSPRITPPGGIALPSLPLNNNNKSSSPSSPVSTPLASSPSPPVTPPSAVAAVVSRSVSRTVSRSQLAALPAVPRTRTPSIVQAAASVAAYNAAAGANFGPLATKNVSDVVGSSVGPAPYLNEIRVAGTIMAEMRAAVESSLRSQPSPVSASMAPTPKTKSAFGKVFSGSSRPTSQLVTPVAAAGGPPSIPLNIQLVATLLNAIRDGGGTKQEGIFRLSGSTSTVRLIYDMMVASPTPDLTETDPNDVASAFKMYMRELSAPLIPFSSYSNLISSVLSPGNVDSETLKQAINSLPPESKSVLRIIVAFMQEVTANQAVTKMNPKNLAIVFGPTLLRSEDPMAGLREAAQQTDVIQELIQRYADYFDPTSYDQLIQAMSLISPSAIAAAASSSSSSAPPVPVLAPRQPAPVARKSIFTRK